MIKELVLYLTKVELENHIYWDDVSLEFKDDKGNKATMWYKMTNNDHDLSKWKVGKKYTIEVKESDN